jgi:23S rRNA pseudouridine1911/1915/1917 synthase
MRESMYALQASLDVLYEDDVLLAVNKPAGVVVHPTYKNATDTLLDTLRDRSPNSQYFLVGRLDRQTSGVVIAARTHGAYVTLQRGWPDVEKDYLAVVRGFVDARGEIDLPLGTDPADRRRRVVRPDGAPSVTRFERLAYSTANGGMSLLRCRLVTGRRHQIRVHLLARGWPIVGDPVYGEPEPGLPRQALHSWRTVMRHPVSGRPLELEALVPIDLRDFLTAARLPFDA